MEISDDPLCDPPSTRPLTRLAAALVLSATAFAAVPAAAGGIAFDLPRLDFPAPGADTTRACPVLTSPAACGDQNG